MKLRRKCQNASTVDKNVDVKNVVVNQYVNTTEEGLNVKIVEGVNSANTEIGSVDAKNVGVVRYASIIGGRKIVRSVAEAHIAFTEL